ncbi:hypothetical protein K9N68_39215 (plasmid) [Kovacikia minuta CCNUW1]|uniref:hypothetical protein n=1 Tax=Kovacikia minuta TaxID=2931930 RepID=UPI001CCB9B92|nr:hypothetical protein [Kovacikia minuta]UBF30174.1 hypothetical protein K9N68_39215 [Kovacikia minuta CCNUW1]
MTARLEYTDVEPSRVQTVPVGGIVRFEPGRSFNPVRSPEQQGHIIPNILGGSDRSAITPFFQDNFISQNAYQNGTPYRDFGIVARNFMDVLYNRYFLERSAHERSHCYKDIPAPPYADIRVELRHDSPNTTVESYFPLRPSHLSAEVVFTQPGSGSSPDFKFIRNLSPIYNRQRVVGEFDNLIRSNGSASIFTTSGIPKFFGLPSFTPNAARYPRS